MGGAFADVVEAPPRAELGPPEGGTDSILDALRSGAVGI